MTQFTFLGATFGGLLVIAGAVGILESGAADVFLEATRPDFQKISLGVVGIQNGGGPEEKIKLGGRIEEVLKKDVKRSLVFDLVDLPTSWSFGTQESRALRGRKSPTCPNRIRRASCS